MQNTSRDDFGVFKKITINGSVIITFPFCNSCFNRFVINFVDFIKMSMTPNPG